MAWTGTIFFGYSNNMYADFDDGTIVTVSSAITDDAASTLELIASIGRDYAKKITDEGYDMAYNWCWGDVLDDVPDEVFAAAGIDLHYEKVAACVAHDEIVVDRIM